MSFDLVKEIYYFLLNNTFSTKAINLRLHKIKNIISTEY